MSERDVQFAIGLCEREDRPIHRAVEPAILNRVKHLSEGDQRLLSLAVTGRHTYREMAGLMGSNPGSVCRRVLLLTRRLSHPMVVALLERPIGLSEKYKHIGLQRYLFKRGVRPIARELEFTEREIRAILNYLVKWMRMSREVANETDTKRKKIVA